MIAFNTRHSWARQTQQSPDSVTQTLQPNVVMDAKVQAAGKDITDADLHNAVETTVNKAF